MTLKITDNQYGRLS